MIADKLVRNTIYASLAGQVITTGISLDGLNYALKSKDMVLKDILMLETVVQFVEALFYIWIIFALKNLKNMTPRRYIDWAITTPTMLLSTVMFMEYKNRKDKPGSGPVVFWEFVENHKVTILKIIFFNAMMLLFGYLGETEVINKNLSVGIGFVFFYLTFKLIYDEYVAATEEGSGYDGLAANNTNMNLFLFVVGFWSLYGVAAVMDLRTKNAMYNILDIFSKNVYGLFLYYYITQVGTRSTNPLKS